MDPAKAMEAMQGVMQNPAFMQMAEKLGRAVQVVSIKTHVESAYGSSA